MRALMPFVLVLPWCLVWAGCGPEAPPQKVHPDVLSRASMQYYWRLTVDLDDDETILRVTRLDENVYCFTSKYRLIAVDAARGLTKWSYQVADLGQTVFEPTHVNGIRLAPKPLGIAGILSPESVGEVEPFDAVLINTLNYVLVLDRSSGEFYRRIPFAFAANTTGVSDGTFFYVGSTEGRLHALLLNEAVRAWTLSADDMITAAVKHHDHYVFMADESGGVFCVDTGQRGQKMWNQTLTGPVTADFYVDGRGLFVPCDDQRLYAFETTTGQRLWDRPFVTQRPLRDAVQVGGQTVFQRADQEMFYALDLQTGNERWSRPDGRLVLGARDGEVYLLNRNNALLFIDEMSGEVRTSLPLAGWELFVANATQPEIYVASRDGALACIREQAAGRLTTEMLRSRQN